MHLKVFTKHELHTEAVVVFIVIMAIMFIQNITHSIPKIYVSLGLYKMLLLLTSFFGQASSLRI